MKVAIPATLLAAAILLLIGVIHLAHGAPPPDADPQFAPWFQGLQQPNGASCCSEADCRPVESRTAGDHYQAFVEGEWLDIPPEKVIRPRSNPIGRAVLCMWHGQVLCFAPPIEV